MDERLERYAELVVRVGANVQPGQEVFLLPKVEHHELARALAPQAYQAGASYVHVAAWRDHTARLKARAETLNELRPDALRYRGPGTDLTVGLLPGVHWLGGGSDTATGITYVANMPTEEIFTSPDAARTEGTIR